MKKLINDPATAALFRPSSMEHVRALGGDPLTLVSEMPLFITPGVGDEIGPPDPKALEWKKKIDAWRTQLATERPAADPRYDPAVDTAEDGAPRPFVCVPLVFRRTPLGVFRAFPREAVALRSAEVLAAALSAAVRNVLLYRSLLESIEELARVRRERGQRAAP